MFYNGCPCNIFIVRIHLRPLKRCKRLRNEEWSTGCNLALPIALFLRNLIISSRNLICKPRYLLHVLFGLRRKSQHEIKLYLIPSPLESLSGAWEDYFFGKPFIDHVPHPLRTCFRGKCQAAFAHILYLSHHLQWKRVYPERRKADVNTLFFEFTDQKSHQFLQLTVIAWT